MSVPLLRYVRGSVLFYALRGLDIPALTLGVLIVSPLAALDSVFAARGVRSCFDGAWFRFALTVAWALSEPRTKRDLPS